MSKQITSRFSENISHIEMDLFIDPNNSGINSNTMTMDKNPGFNLRFYPSMVDDNIRDNISTLTPEGSHGEQGKIYIPTTVKLEKTRLEKLNKNEKLVLNSLYHTLQYINSFPKKASLDELYDIIEHNIEYILDLYLPPGGEIFLRRGKNAGKIHAYGFDKYTINFAKWKKYKVSSQQKLELKNKLTNLQLEYDKSKSLSVDINKEHGKSNQGYEGFLDKSEQIKELYSQEVDEFNKEIAELYNLMQDALKYIESRHDKGLGYIPATKPDKQEKYYGMKKTFKEDIKQQYLNKSNELSEGPFLFTLENTESSSHKLLKIFDETENDIGEFISLRQFMRLMVDRTEKTIKEISYGITAYTYYHLKYIYGTPISDYDSNNVILSAANNTVHKLNLLTKENLTPVSIKCNYPTAICKYSTINSSLLFIGYSNGLLSIKDIRDINNVQDLLSINPLNNQSIVDIYVYSCHEDNDKRTIILNNNDNNIYLFNLLEEENNYKLFYKKTLNIFCGDLFSKLKLNDKKIKELKIYDYNYNNQHISFLTEDNFYYLSITDIIECYPLLINSNTISSYHIFNDEQIYIIIGYDNGSIEIYIEDSYEEYYINSNSSTKLLPKEKANLHSGNVKSITHIQHHDKLYIVTISIDNSIIFSKLIVNNNKIDSFEKELVMYTSYKISSMEKDSSNILYLNIDNSIYKLDDKFYENILDKTPKTADESFININNMEHFIKLEDNYENILVNHFILPDTQYLYSYNNEDIDIHIWDLDNDNILRDDNNKLNTIVDEKIAISNHINNLSKGEIINGNRHINIVTEQQIYYNNIDTSISKQISITDNNFINWYMPTHDNVSTKIITNSSFNSYNAILNNQGCIFVYDNTCSNHLDNKYRQILCNNDFNALELIEQINKNDGLMGEMKGKLVEFITDILKILSVPIQKMLSCGYDLLEDNSKLLLQNSLISHVDGTAICINKIGHIQFNDILITYGIKGNDERKKLINKSKMQKKNIYIVSGGFNKSARVEYLPELKMWQQIKHIEITTKLIAKKNNHGEININLPGAKKYKDKFDAYISSNQQLYFYKLPNNFFNDICNIDQDMIWFKFGDGIIKELLDKDKKKLMNGGILLLKTRPSDGKEIEIIPESEFIKNIENVDIINELGRVDDLLYKYFNTYHYMRNQSELISHTFKNLLIEHKIITSEQYHDLGYEKVITHILLQDKMIIVVCRINDFSVLSIIPYCDITEDKIIKEYISDSSRIFKLDGIINSIEYNKRHYTLIYSINDKLIMRNIDELFRQEKENIYLDDDNETLKHGDNSLYEQLTTRCISNNKDKAHDTDIVALSTVENYIISKSITHDKKSYSLKSWESDKEDPDNKWERTSELCITTYSDGLKLNKSPILVYKDASIFDELEGILKNYFDKETTKKLKRKMGEINRKLGFNYKKYKELELKKQKFRKLWSQLLGKDFYEYPISTMWKDIELSEKRQPSIPYGIDFDKTFIGLLEEKMKTISQVNLSDINEKKRLVERATTETEIRELYDKFFMGVEDEHLVANEGTDHDNDHPRGLGRVTLDTTGGNRLISGGTKEEQERKERDKKYIDTVRIKYNERLKKIFPKYYEVDNLVRDLTTKDVITEIENLLRLKEYCLDENYKNFTEKTLKKMIDKFEKKKKERDVIKLEIKRYEREDNIQDKIKVQYYGELKELKNISNELRKHTSTGASDILDLLIKKLREIKIKKVKELEEDIKEIVSKKTESLDKFKKKESEEIITDKDYTKDVLGKIYIALLKGHGIVDEVKYKDANVENNKIKLYQAQHNYYAALGGWSNKYTMNNVIYWTTNKLFPTGYKIDIDLAVIPYNDPAKYPYMQSKYFKCAEKAKDVDNNLSKLFGLKTDWAKDLLYGTPFKNIQNALSNNLLIDVPYTTDKQKAAYVADKSKIKEKYKKRAAAQKRLGLGSDTDAKKDLQRYLNKQILEEQAKQLVKQMSKDDILKDMQNITLDNLSGGKKIVKDKRKIREKIKHTQRNKRTHKHNRTINKRTLRSLY